MSRESRATAPAASATASPSEQTRTSCPSLSKSTTSRSDRAQRTADPTTISRARPRSASDPAAPGPPRSAGSGPARPRWRAGARPRAGARRPRTNSGASSRTRSLSRATAGGILSGPSGRAAWPRGQSGGRTSAVEKLRATTLLKFMAVIQKGSTDGHEMPLGRPPEQGKIRAAEDEMTIACLTLMLALSRSPAAPARDRLPLPDDTRPGRPGQAPGGRGPLQGRLAGPEGQRGQAADRDAAQPGRPLGPPAALPDGQLRRVLRPPPALARRQKAVEAAARGSDAAPGTTSPGRRTFSSPALRWTRSPSRLDKGRVLPRRDVRRPARARSRGLYRRARNGERVR